MTSQVHGLILLGLALVSLATFLIFWGRKKPVVWPEGLDEEKQVAEAERLLEEMKNDHFRLPGHPFWHYSKLLQYYPRLCNKGYGIERANDLVEATKRSLSQHFRQSLETAEATDFGYAFNLLVEVDPSYRVKRDELYGKWLHASLRRQLTEAREMEDEQRRGPVLSELLLSWFRIKERIEREFLSFDKELFCETESFLIAEKRLAPKSSS